MGTKERRRRERSARQEQIIEAAKGVFKERGFLNTTIEEIAQRSELAVGTLYRYFQSKEELYISILFEAMILFYDHIETVQASIKPPDEQLRAIWNFFYDFYTEQPEYYKAFMFLHNEGLQDVISSETLEAINRRAGENFRLVGQIVKAGVEAGLYHSELDTRNVVDVLWSLLMGLVQLVETRRNLGVRADMLKTLHQEAFEWVECGLRKSQNLPGSSRPISRVDEG